MSAHIWRAALVALGATLVGCPPDDDPPQCRDCHVVCTGLEGCGEECDCSRKPTHGDV